MQLTATVYTVDDSVLSGRSVTYNSSDGSIATVNASGLVVASGAYGTATITATTQTSSGAPVSTTLTIVAFDASRVNVPQAIALDQAISTSVIVGTSTPVRVKVTDVYGHPAVGATVNFNIALGSGTVSPSSATTDAAGIATTSWTVGTDGSSGNAVTARVGTVQITFNCFPIPGPVVSLAMLSPFAGFTVGDDALLSVNARDAYGNPVMSSAVQFTVRDPSLLEAPDVQTLTSVRVTSKAAGQTYVVATANGLADSTLVAVFPTNGVLVSAAVPRFDLKTDTTFGIGVQISTGPLTPPIGSLTVHVTWDPAVLTYISDSPSQFSGSLVINRDNAANGSLTLAAAAGTSLGGATSLRLLTFKAASTANQHGTLAVTVSDINANDFTSLLSATQVVSFTVRTR